MGCSLKHKRYLHQIYDHTFWLSWKLVCKMLLWKCKNAYAPYSNNLFSMLTRTKYNFLRDNLKCLVLVIKQNYIFAQYKLDYLGFSVQRRTTTLNKEKVIQNFYWILEIFWGIWKNGQRTRYGEKRNSSNTKQIWAIHCSILNFFLRFDHCYGPFIIT